ncbi:MAG: hypothetical protein Q8900_07975, partial [Bacillota bacterium]|nr:hypothetical protein [Bacillota bacterium]
IKSYFSVNYDKFKIIYKKSYIIYDITNDSFIMYSYLDDYYHREDIYSYKVVDGKVCFIYKNTVYNLGKVVT